MARSEVEVRPEVNPHLLPPATHTALQRAAGSLREAIHSTDTDSRYACAHVAALRAATALLAVRGRPERTGQRRRTGSTTRRRSGRGSGSRPAATRAGPQPGVWELLEVVAPELAEWGEFFRTGAAKRRAVETGRRQVVTAREADDLLRDADRFLAVVERALGLLPHVPVEAEVPWRAGGAGRTAR